MKECEKAGSETRQQPAIMISTITKRDGRTVTFNLEKIANAIAKALRVTGEADEA